jgi:hypothetical protein
MLLLLKIVMDDDIVIYSLCCLLNSCIVYVLGLDIEIYWFMNISPPLYLWYSQDFFDTFTLVCHEEGICIRFCRSASGI